MKLFYLLHTMLSTGLFKRFWSHLQGRSIDYLVPRRWAPTSRPPWRRPVPVHQANSITIYTVVVGRQPLALTTFEHRPAFRVSTLVAVAESSMKETVAFPVSTLWPMLIVRLSRWRRLNRTDLATVWSMEIIMWRPVTPARRWTREPVIIFTGVDLYPECLPSLAATTMATTTKVLTCPSRECQLITTKAQVIIIIIIVRQILDNQHGRLVSLDILMRWEIDRNEMVSNIITDARHPTVNSNDFKSI